MFFASNCRFITLLLLVLSCPVTGYTATASQRLDVEVKLQPNTCEPDTWINNGQIKIPLGNYILPGNKDDTLANAKYTLSMRNCVPGTRVNISGQGAADDDDPVYYKNSGTAAGVALYLILDEIPLVPGAPADRVALKADSTGNIEMDINAQLIQTTGSVIDGSVDVIVTLNFAYP